ncbi:MAG: hypothetical protein H0S80_07360 [Desulfovibrionaceae bacterium]|nr:hypothetical protein [Desulfovibrionaceae bacterium]
MNAAFSIWEDRIAPVFDTAPQLAIVPGARGGGATTLLSTPSASPAVIIAILLERHVATLVCGAISRPIHDAIAARNIEIHPFVTGTLDNVVKAWKTGRLHEDEFRMPGCGQTSGGWRRKRRRGGRTNMVHAPYGTPAVPDGQAICRCPHCGREILHEPGVPCSSYRCPDCHAPMVRA